MNVPRPLQAIQDNIARVIKGKSHVIEMAVVCLLARGHLLLEDVPPDDPKRGDLEQIKRSAEAALELLNRMLPPAQPAP